MENQLVPPIAPPTPVPQTNPQETTPQIRKKSLNKLLVLFPFLFLIVSSIVGYFFYRNSFPNNETEKNINQEEIRNPKELIINNNPEEVVRSFLKSSQVGDKKTARELLSPNVNKESFKATLEDNPNTPSLFGREFTFMISDVKTTIDGKTAYVNVELMIEGQKIVNLWTLTKDASENWLIVDSMATGSLKDSFFGRQIPSSNKIKKVLLTLSGPADFYLTNPEGKKVGIDPKTKTEVNEISGVVYSGPEPIGIESLAITDIYGIWNLAIVGNGFGEYVLNTELVDPENHQTEVIKKVASKNSIDYFLLEYPRETGQPLKIQAVLQR